ncbi:MAG: leucine-rich repeat domain-containing protein, partial [Porphyromonadaceae bacterium]|nr:leucine-rich repeat domain-containing protein [Porphyromonadaceae bacterium]
TIPETVTYGGSTYAVTAIERWAFGYCSELTSVTIPESVTSIGDDAFSGCTSLASITIPNSVTKIESATFDSCYALESVTIGSGVTSIAALAFYKCTSLTEIYSLNPTPPTIITMFAFFKVDMENCVLYVPEGSYEAYATANAWRGFLNIVEVDFGGIEETISDNADASEIARYDISGRLLSEPQKGINIVRYSDGTVEKVIVK